MDIWPRLDDLIDRAPTLGDLHAHRLHLYAAWRWRAQGRPIPRELGELERGAGIVRLAAPMLLRRVLAAYEGTVIVIKGPEAAARYPKPELRPYGDLDLLVEDAAEAQSALLASGFRESEAIDPDWWRRHHHERPLEWPGLPVPVEIHRRPNWPAWLPEPRTEELFSAASATSVLGGGALALSAEHHALVLTAHLWDDTPFARLGHLVDVMTAVEAVNESEVRALARRWGMERLWDFTMKLADHLLCGPRRLSKFEQAWARQMETMRDRTVLQAKLAMWSAPFCGLPLSKAVPASAKELTVDLGRLAPGETYRAMVARKLGALRTASMRRFARTQLREAATRQNLKRERLAGSRAGQRASAADDEAERT